MLLSDLLSLLDLKLDADDLWINHFKTNSREITSGDAFIAINDGYKYALDAIKRGATIIITEKDIDVSSFVLRVDDTVKVLGKIAHYLRLQYEGMVIAITGSTGKSTTKEMLTHLLSKKYKVLSNYGSLNNHIGVPNTLLGIDNSYDYVILELGTNHPGEIKYLADIVKPDLALITNIGASHIGNFGSKKKILEEKLNIKTPTTILFVNGEDELLNKLDAIKVYKNDYDIVSSPYMMNTALVYEVGTFLGYNPDEIKDNLKDFTNLSSRMNYINIDDITIIDDAYNASFESVLGGLDAIKDYPRKIIVLGDMLELGKYSEKLHQDIYQKINGLSNVILLTIGPETEKLNNKLHFNTLDDIIAYFKKFTFLKGDVIYLKGSHKMELFKLVTPLEEIIKEH